MKTLDVAIIGSGTAGLSARSQVAKLTNNYLVFDGGPLGTTCARVGCMPSKVLIQVANDFNVRTKFERRGVRGAQDLVLDDAALLEHVRSLRDRFVRAVMGSMKDWQATHLVRHHARLVGPNTIEAGGEHYQAKKIILATGGRPSRPKSWANVASHLSDSDGVFEWTHLPKRLAIIGLGVIGVELGQAFARLGVEVVGLSLDKALGGLTDPVLQEYAVSAFGHEFAIDTSGVRELSLQGGELVITSGQSRYTVDRALVATGRTINLDGLGLDVLGVPLDTRGLPPIDEGTHRIVGTDVYLAGDANGSRPLLHEAADEGWIAGYNAVRKSDTCFARRTPLSITFCEPNISIVGASWRSLKDSGADFVTGAISFEGYGRAIIRLEEVGLGHIYAERTTGRILGAELFVPAGEHLGHLLAWAIQSSHTVDDALAMPFYHPVFEEGIKTALRDARSQLDLPARPLEVLRCNEMAGS
jgi:dihydrolipoamide dehydrogenase